MVVTLTEPPCCGARQACSSFIDDPFIHFSTRFFFCYNKTNLFLSFLEEKKRKNLLKKKIELTWCMYRLCGKCG